MEEVLSLGQKLAAERKAQKRKLSDVATDLNIRESYLKAIEEDDYSKLPGKAYIAGFIKVYAEYLGLDYQLFLKALRATQNLQEDYQNMPKALKGEKRRQKKIFKVSLVLLFIVVASVHYYNYIVHEIDIRHIEEQNSVSETLLTFFNKTQNITNINADEHKESISHTEDLSQIKTPEVAIVNTESIESIELHNQKSKPPFARILLKADKDVWVQIRNLEDKKIYVSSVLPKNKYYWVAPWSNVVLDVADAASLEIIIDDKQLGKLGKSSKRIRGLNLDVDYLEQYFLKGENLNTDTVENY